jgi:predicted amidophosphoribosyltransferase
MPKLSKQTLEKRFLCPHCARTFRTRQGLSGHIQYKHKLGTPSEENPYMDAVVDAYKFKQRAESAGFTKEQISEMGQIFVFWNSIKYQIKDEKITLNNNDWKNYLIVSMAQMRANQQLFNKLNQALGIVTSEMLKIQSNTAANIFKKSF